MDKKTKILLGVGALAVVGYLVWKNNQPAKTANATGRKGTLSSMLTLDTKEICGCDCGYNEKNKEYLCRDGQHANSSKGKCPPAECKKAIEITKEGFI